MNILQKSATNKEQIPRYIIKNPYLTQEKIICIKKMKDFLIDILDERKALHIKHFDLSTIQNSIADTVICATHVSPTASAALAKYLKIVIKRYSIYTSSAEIDQERQWVAIDIGHTIVHIFSQEAREKYQLDELLLQRIYLKSDDKNIVTHY